MISKSNFLKSKLFTSASIFHFPFSLVHADVRVDAAYLSWTAQGTQQQKKARDRNIYGQGRN
jgi:hypothetical protein